MKDGRGVCGLFVIVLSQDFHTLSPTPNIAATGSPLVATGNIAFEEIPAYFKAGVVGFGIGTHLTNDMGVKTLNIVMKLTECNGRPVAKLSDSPGKTMCDNQTFLAYLRQVFNVPATS